MDQLSPGEALSRLKQLITSGKCGYNYTFERTEKNRLLTETYHIDDNKKIEVLKSLNESDYVKDEYSNSEDHPDDYMYVFIKRGISLLPKVSNDLVYKQVDIYIKFYFFNEKKSIAVILSFHEAGDY